MPVNASDIAAQMRQSLRVTEPTLDTSIGTPVRKMLDAVAEVVAEGYVDRYLVDYQYDIDAKAGSDLDDFVALFGLTRLPAKRATGLLTFERMTAATAGILIPVGTQTATNDSPPVIFATLVPAVLPQGQTAISVPIQAVLGGASGNVPAGTIGRQVSPLDGLSTFSNPSAMTGGADGESDSQLRLRFKRTVFRNLAGTEAMFVGVALDDPAVTQVNVIGATKTRREQVQVLGGTAVSTVPDAVYVYTDSVVFGPSIDTGQILTPDVHFTFSGATPPVITSLDSTNCPDGIYDLEFDYTPTSSRNAPASGITNRVDVYVSGQRPTQADETAIFKTARAFSNTGPYDIANFQRDTGSPPLVGNWFVPLSFMPVLPETPPQTITIGSATYNLDTDFWFVNDITKTGGTPESVGGIEVKSFANGFTSDPSDNLHFAITYSFNAVPRDVERAIGAWRLVTTDVKVHQAKTILLNLNLVVIIAPGFSSVGVQAEMFAALSGFIAGLGFNSFVQISDLLEIAHQVPGVDAVRFAKSTDDAVYYAINRMNNQGAILSTYQFGGRAIDIAIGDDEVPVLNAIRLFVRAQNTFGQV